MLLTLAPTVSVQGVKAGIINLVAIRLKQRKKPEADPVMKAELMELSMCVISLCCVWCGRELVSAFSLVLELYCSLFWYHMYITKIIVFVSLTERERDPYLKLSHLWSSLFVPYLSSHKQGRT